MTSVAKQIDFKRDLHPLYVKTQVSSLPRSSNQRPRSVHVMALLPAPRWRNPRSRKTVRLFKQFARLTIKNIALYLLEHEDTY